MAEVPELAHILKNGIVGDEIFFEPRAEVFAQHRIGIEKEFPGVTRNRDVAFHAALGGADRRVTGGAVGKTGHVVGRPGR